MEIMYRSKKGEIRTKESWCWWMYQAIEHSFGRDSKGYKSNFKFQEYKQDVLWEKCLKLLDLEEVVVTDASLYSYPEANINLQRDH